MGSFPLSLAIKGAVPTVDGKVKRRSRSDNYVPSKVFVSLKEVEHAIVKNGNGRQPGSLIVGPSSSSDILVVPPRRAKSAIDQGSNSKISRVFSPEALHPLPDLHASSDSSDGGEASSVSDTYTATFYKKISSIFDGFKGLMFSNRQLQYPLLYSQPQAEGAEGMDNHGLSITQRLAVTMDNFFKAGSRMERFVAFFPTISVPLAGFDMSSAFVPEHDNILDCFALFIQDSKPMDEPTSSLAKQLSALDNMGKNLRWEIVNKVSNQVISESGPYHCVFEENIDSGTSDETFSSVLNDMLVKKGRLRFFQAMKSLGKYKENLSRRMSRGLRDSESETPPGYGGLPAMVGQNIQAPGNFLKTRIAMLGEYLARKSEGGASSPRTAENAANEGSHHGSGMLKWNFSAFNQKRQEEASHQTQADESAQHRMEEHIRLHTGHWDEFQYDQIEIVLRDDNDSVVNLPYSCAVM